MDADYRDTEAFYAAAERQSVDRNWPRLSDALDALISRFDVFMAKKMSGAKPTSVNALRAEILRHVRGRAGDRQGSNPKRPIFANPSEPIPRRSRREVGEG